MPRKGKGVKRIIREQKRFTEKRKQGKKAWKIKKGKNVDHDEVG
ncbi:MAG: hypothetical protein ACW99F_07580 [Candidatus Hodarchaeales archaeon]|jgi:hypothetical protein